MNTSQLKRASSAALQLDWGEKVLMQFAGVPKKVTSEVVGLDKDKFILVRLPNMLGLRNVISPGGAVTVRYMHSSRVFFGFSATIAGVITNPFPLLFLNYPKMIEMLPLRKHERLDCFIKANMYYNAEDYPAAILNLSEGGCRLMLDPLPADKTGQAAPDMVQGSEVLCQFKLPGEQEDIFANAVVRSRFEVNSRITLGLQFIDMDMDFHKGITSYINNLQEYAKDIEKAEQ